MVLKENQPRMWDDGKNELVVPGHPTRARRVSLGCPGTTSECLPSSHILGSFSFIICQNYSQISLQSQNRLTKTTKQTRVGSHCSDLCAPTCDTTCVFIGYKSCRHGDSRHHDNDRRCGDGRCTWLVCRCIVDKSSRNTL